VKFHWWRFLNNGEIFQDEENAVDFMCRADHWWSILFCIRKWRQTPWGKGPRLRDTASDTKFSVTACTAVVKKKRQFI
jgi:hypothetical protein